MTLPGTERPGASATAARGRVVAVGLREVIGSFACEVLRGIFARGANLRSAMVGDIAREVLRAIFARGGYRRSAIVCDIARGALRAEIAFVYSWRSLPPSAGLFWLGYLFAGEISREFARDVFFAGGYCGGRKSAGPGLSLSSAILYIGKQVKSELALCHFWQSQIFLSCALWPIAAFRGRRRRTNHGLVFAGFCARWPSNLVFCAFGKFWFLGLGSWFFFAFSAILVFAE